MQLPCEKFKISCSLDPLTFYFNSLLFCAVAIIIMFDLTQNPRAHLGLPQGTAVCYHYPLTRVWIVKQYWLKIYPYILELLFLSLCLSRSTEV